MEWYYDIQQPHASDLRFIYAGPGGLEITATSLIGDNNDTPPTVRIQIRGTLSDIQRDPTESGVDWDYNLGEYNSSGGPAAVGLTVPPYGRLILNTSSSDEWVAVKNSRGSWAPGILDADRDSE